MTVESRLTQDQEQQADACLERLKPEDRANVEKVLEILKYIVEQYEEEVGLRYRDLTAFVGAYAIGGWVNKEGPRKDVDLLVAHSINWEEAGYFPIPEPDGKNYAWESGRDRFIEMLANHFGNNGFDIEIPDDIPDEYSSEGVRNDDPNGFDPRIMIRLRPQGGNDASPVDVVYVSGGFALPRINTFDKFYEYDKKVSPDESIGRVALLETIISKPSLPTRP